jgi:hypothetical protein
MPERSRHNLLFRCVTYGSTETMRYVHRWNSEDEVGENYDEMMSVAAGYGHEDAMALLQQWATEASTPINYAEPLKYAAGRGQVGAMLLLKQWAEEAGKPFTSDDLLQALTCARQSQEKAVVQLLQEQMELLSTVRRLVVDPRLLLAGAFDELFEMLT